MPVQGSVDQPPGVYGCQMHPFKEFQDTLFLHRSTECLQGLPSVAAVLLPEISPDESPIFGTSASSRGSTMAAQQEKKKKVSTVSPAIKGFAGARSCCSEDKCRLHLSSAQVARPPAWGPEACSAACTVYMGTLCVVTSTSCAFMIRTHNCRLSQQAGTTHKGPLCFLLPTGSMGGIAESVCLQPIDVIKTRLQLDNTGRYKGVLHCGTTIAREEGVRSLWKGLTPFAANLTLKYALRFSTNSGEPCGMQQEGGAGAAATAGT